MRLNSISSRQVRQLSVCHVTFSFVLTVPGAACVRCRRVGAEVHPFHLKRLEDCRGRNFFEKDPICSSTLHFYFTNQSYQTKI